MGREFGLRMLAAVLLSLGSISGCSVNKFKDPVKTFDASVGTTKDVVAKYDEAFQQLSLTSSIEAAIGKNDNLLFEAAKCKIGASEKDCGVFDISSQQYLLPEASPPQPGELAKALASYSNALVGVVNADTSNDLDKSADNLDKAADKLATTLNKDSKISATLDPITTIFKFLAGNYLEYRRFEILKAAVTQADPLVQEASTNLAKLILDRQTIVLQSQADLVQNLVASADHMRPQKSDAVSSQTPLNRATQRQLLLAATAGATTAEGLAKANAADAISKLGAAHHALAKGVNAPEAGLADTFDEIKAFGQQINNVYDAIKKLT